MDLLVFAHRGEAQCFLKEMELKAHPLNNSLYTLEDQSVALIITGEGHNNVLTGLSLALGQLSGNVQRIINFGICAALNEQLQKNEIHSIRTIYGQDEFKSFQTIDTQAKHDLITAKQRLLDTKESQKLEHIAPLADREGWAIGLVAKQANIDLLSYKLISDHVSDAPICEYIKELSQDYSQKLFEFYQELELIEKASSIENPFKEQSDYYFTLSLNREVSNLCQQLCVKYEKENINDIIDTTSLLNLETTPKKRALKLRDQLKEKLYPTRTKILGQLDSFIQDAGFEKKELTYDPAIEKVFLNLKINIKSEKDIKELTRKLKNINWNEYQSIMNGENL
ncbi:hypothetical protein [Halobacteriovorax sp.]|uniref:hypothetical protein n=1 Tax=Halobacteriovorax sp. TaxID=2020862 RepID=UPI003AF2D45F